MANCSLDKISEFSQSFLKQNKTSEKSRFKDWKTSDRVKTQLSDCWDDPIQIAAYCSILGLNKGALVKMYENEPPNIIFMNEGKGLEF